MQAQEWFAADWETARARFLETAAAAGATMHRLDLQAAGLPIDIAWLGPAHPRRVVLHSAGLHGVEGFAGSAIQLALLAQPPALPAGTALILVHVLNPYGMRAGRRVNEHNVDLNRNCLEAGEWRGAPPMYAHLDPLLNPPSPPRADGFHMRALGRLVRHGYAALRQAIVEGQYAYPRGLFYGGARLEEGPLRYREWLSAHLSGVEQLWAVDVHTGLGGRGRELLFAEAGSAQARDALQARLGAALTWVEPGMAQGYINRGGLCAALPSWLPGVQIAALVEEFGTCSAVRVLHALREENRWHHYGTGATTPPSTARLKEVFCPADPLWRRRVVERGTALVRRIVQP